METARSYGDACGIAQGLDLVGERWALLVVRELLFGPRRFTDLRTGLPGASANVLSQRLRELERSGVLQRRRLAAPAASWVYELTAWGQALEPIVTGLGSWALQAERPGTEGTLSAVSALLTLKTFTPGDQLDEGSCLELRFGDDCYTVRSRDGELEIGAGTAPDAAASIRTEPATFVRLLGDDADLASLIAAGTVEVTGDLAAVRRLFAAAQMPRAHPVQP